MKSTANDFSAPRPRKTGGCRALLAILLLAGFAFGCATSSWREARETRFQSARQLTPLPEIEIVVSDLEADLARTSFGDVERRSLTRMSQLADIFYQRLSHRRVNSISTFHDPALREFFHSPEAFADYYADFADDLAMASFEYNRPNSFVIEDFEFESDGSVQIRIVFTGESNKPLRFWNTRLLRSDRWEYADGRWWITPGKL